MKWKDNSINRELSVYLISDWIGETAERVAKASTSQFLEDRFRLFKKTKVAEPGDLDEIFRKAADGNSVIMFTVVEGPIREVIKTRSESLGIPAVDILQPAFDVISALTGHQPILKPGLGRELDRGYFEKIEALDFAVRCDDGQDPRGLKKADLVLIGVSRTTKTPVSIYLSAQGWKVANYPLVKDVPPPPVLFELPSKKVVGLTINANLLRAIRQERVHLLGVKGKTTYIDIKEIYEELEYAEKIMNKIGCRKIDVTQKAVEETVDEIVKMLRPEL